MPDDVDSSVITAATLGNARQIAATSGKRLVEALQEVSGLSGEHYTKSIAQWFGYEVASMDDLRESKARFDLIPFRDCLQRRCLPYDRSDGKVGIAFTDPFDAEFSQWASFRAGLDCKIALAQNADIVAALARHEEGLRAMEDSLPAGSARTSDDLTLDLSIASITEDSSPVVRLVNSTLYDALKLGASDIHLETSANALYVKYRIDGVLVDVMHAPGIETAEQVISRVKVLAELDIAERRIPQDGRFKARVKGTDIDFRVSVMPSIFGEDAVLRLLDRRALTQSDELRLEALGLSENTVRSIRRLAMRPHGMLLVTGPTGSGKTTTLYAALSEINTGRDKIVTIEDPVEYRLQRVLQIPVNEKKGLTFARGLRSILRHDPDTIMVGEIRDPETAQIAVQAALTGHLVFTTVHANNVFDVLSRFLHMDVDPYALASALNAIVAQRLLRINCVHCSQPTAPADDLLDMAEIEPRAASAWNFQAGAGCGYCRGSGFKGRKAVAEVLVLDDHLRDLIATKASVLELKEAARLKGLRPIRESALKFVESGDTTLAEVYRVAA